MTTARRISGAYGIVYSLTNAVNAKVYVGQTKLTLDSRWAAHVHRARRSFHNQPIIAAIRKYGPEAFTRVEIARAANQAELDALEVEWVTRLNAWAPDGYNLRAGNGPGSVSPELRERMKTAFTDARREHLRSLYVGRQLPELARRNAIASRVVSIKIYSPDGVLTAIENVEEFCRANGVAGPNFSKAAKGLRESAGRWSVIPRDEREALREDFRSEILAIFLDGRRYRCPVCAREWESPSLRMANQHVHSCAMGRELIRAAHALGNIPAAEAEAFVKPLRGMVLHRVLVSPTGERHYVDSARGFAIEHDLSRNGVNGLVTGRLDSYLGWTRPAAATEAEQL